MALSNGRVKATIYTTVDASYTVAVSGTTIFSGMVCYPGSGSSVEIDITEILKPYVHAEEITALTSGSGPDFATYSVSAPGHTVTSGSGTLSYCNDYAATSIPNSLSAKTWGLDKINGQYYFSYAAQGGWTGSQYGSFANTCQYNAEIIFTDVYGMPQGIPVRAIPSVNTEWEGYTRPQDFQSKKHRNVPLKQTKTISYTCHTPNLTRENRTLLARWLGQAEFVYLYDIAEGQLIPCKTPAVSAGSGMIEKMTITLNSDY